MSSSFLFFDRLELDDAVAEWNADQALATDEYGDISTWDVSLIKDFSRLFADQENFNSDIRRWNVSSGTNFASMFEGATSFDQNI